MVKRQTQSSAILSNFDPQNSNAVGGFSDSAAAADSSDLQQAAILGAFLLSSTPSVANPNDVYAISDAADSVAASPLPASSADAISGSGFQAATIADASNVSTSAPLALSQHASDESGQSVTDTGINVGVLSDSISNLDCAAQAVADAALPLTSDIQTLNELSSSGTDEVQIVHDVAHGASMACYPVDSGEQNFSTGIVVTNAANAQDAASNALGTPPASITGFSVSTEPTITIAAVTSVDMPGNLAPGTAVAVSPDYSWVGFAVQGSQIGGSQSGTGSSVVAETSGGITIDLIFDTAAMAAPASFRTGMEQAASLLAAAITDKITVNINIDYSGTGGGASAGPDNGVYETYTSVRADLISNATPGDTTFNALPSGSSIQGQSDVAVWNAQLKLFGLLSPNSTSTDDGSATFATDIQSNLLVGVALHELTHAMGRVPFGSAPDIFDLFRFTSAGNYLFSGNIPVPSAYFSVNGGTTNLAYYGQNSDPSDFLTVSPNLNDPFDEYYSSNTLQTLTPLDLEQLDALGFHLTSSTSTPPPNVTEVLVSDTGSSSSDKITSNDALTGSGNANAVVHFTVDGVAIASTVTANASSIWTFTPTGLADGSHTIVASETNTSGTGTASLTFTLDTKDVVAITSTGGSITTPTQTISGSVTDVAAVGTTVTILDGTTAIGTTTVQANGSWSDSITLTGNGTHTLTATDTDVAGNLGTSNAVIYTLNAAVPAVTESLVSDTGSSSSDKITSNDALTGSGNANAVVHFTVDGVAIASTVTANASSIWTFTPTGLADGSHTIVASETNTSGTGTASLTFTLDTKDVVAITSTGGSITTPTQTISGSVTDVAAVGTTVTILDGTTAIGTTTVQANGSWSDSITLTGNGTHTLTATDTDVAGNLGTSNAVIYTLNAAVPAVTESLVSDTGSSSSDKITSNDALTGSGNANAVVHFTVDGVAIASTVTANASGIWTFTPTGLADGSHTIVASETNTSGTGTASLTFTLDTKDVVAITSTGGSITTPTQTISGSVTDVAAVGTTVTILDGTTAIGTTTVQANGSWSDSITLTGNGTHTLTATDTDVAGNLGTSNAVTYSLSPIGPSSATITATTDTGATDLNVGHLITITVTTGLADTVTGLPTLQLNDGEVAGYTGGSGTNTLTFSYAVQPGDNVADLQVTGLNLPTGSSIVDSNGHSLSGPVTADLGIQIDTTTVPLTSVQQEILGLYGALYNRAADFGSYSYWVNTVGQQADGGGVTTANAGNTAVTVNDAAVLGQLFVNTQSSYFNSIYGGLSDSAFINAMYLNIGGNAGDSSGIAYWANLLQQAETAGQSVQAARAGLVGQFVHDLIDYNINDRPAGLTDAQWQAAVQRQEAIDNKIAVSLDYSNASQQPGGSILVAHTVGDTAYQAATTILQSVTYNPATVTAAIVGINIAVAHQELLLI